MRGQDAALARRNQNDGTGAVAEQHAGAAIVPIENARIDLRADDECVTRHAACNHSISERQCVNESRTHGLQIKCRAAMRAQFFLQDARGRRKNHVRRRRRDDHDVDLRRRNIRFLKGDA